MSQEESIPPGFESVGTGLGFTDSLQPIYRYFVDGEVKFGLRVDAQHCNSLGICHGGVLMTLGDITAASGVGLACGKVLGHPTVNLSMDFINAAKKGEWIEGRTDLVEIKRRFGFSSGGIYNERGLVARFNTTFYLPDHRGMVQKGATGDGILRGLSSEED